MTATVEHVKGDRGRPGRQAQCPCGYRGDRTGNAEFARQQAEGHVCETEPMTAVELSAFVGETAALARELVYTAFDEDVSRSMRIVDQVLARVDAARPGFADRVFAAVRLAREFPDMRERVSP